MPNHFMKFLNRKKAILSAVLFGALVITTIFIQGITEDIKKLSVLQDGMGTCFNRVQQSYTANLLGDLGSNYLGSDFLANTEECVSEVSEMAEKNFKTLLSSNIKRLNSFATDLHWFHQRLIGKGESSLINNPEEVIKAGFTSRFQKLEKEKDRILAVSNEKITGLEASLFSSKVAFYLLVIFLPILMIWEFFERREKSKNNQELNTKAHELLLDGKLTQKLEVERILKRALEQNDLNYCSKLFSNYQDYLESQSDQGRKLSIEKEVRQVHYSGDKRLESKIDAVWDEDNGYELNDGSMKSTSILDILSKVIDGFSNTLQDHGIVLNVNIDQDAEVYADAESLEQIFYYITSSAIDSCLKKKDNSQKKIKISSSSLGGSYILEVSHNGQEFSKEVIKMESGAVSSSEIDKVYEEHLGMGMQISAALINDCDGKIEFENTYSKRRKKKRNIVGASSRILFNIKRPAPKKSGANLVHLKKGKKSEILKDMAST